MHCIRVLPILQGVWQNIFIFFTKIPHQRRDIYDKSLLLSFICQKITH
ncbi:hypothetical protein [Moraxella lacunata]